MEKRTFRLPDNWHAHLRQDRLLDAIYHHFNIYGRVLCMGNTSPMIETPDKALYYEKYIRRRDGTFEPVACIMLTENTTPQIIFEAARKGIKFVKFIPIGTSTGATHGLRLDDFESLIRIIKAIESAGMRLLIHAELNSLPNENIINELYREEMAIPCLLCLLMIVPGLKITIEHVSTAKMINFVLRQKGGNVRATLTPHHALLTYDQVYNKRGRLINPYNYCLPVLKREKDRRAIEKAMVSGDERFFAGTDAAPHWQNDKEGKFPRPGIFFGQNEYLRYLEIFERNGAMDKFEDFTSRFGAEAYGYPLNTGEIIVRQGEWYQPVSENGIRFTMSEIPLRWKIEKVVY